MNNSTCGPVRALHQTICDRVLSIQPTNPPSCKGLTEASPRVFAARPPSDKWSRRGKDTGIGTLSCCTSRARGPLSFPLVCLPTLQSQNSQRRFQALATTGGHGKAPQTHFITNSKTPRISVSNIDSGPVPHAKHLLDPLQCVFISKIRKS